MESKVEGCMSKCAAVITKDRQCQQAENEDTPTPRSGFLVNPVNPVNPVKNSARPSPALNGDDQQPNTPIQNPKSKI